jgi:gliding motility-associated-like protein
MFPKTLLRIFFFAFTLAMSLSARAVTAGFTSNTASGCAPLTVQFTNTSTGATSYSWNLGNGNTSQQTNTSGTYPTAGTYTITLTAINGSATSTYSVTITVYSPPSVSFTGSPTTICAHSSVTFTDQSTLNSPGTALYSWNFGNGASGSGTPITYTYNTAGTYNVYLTVMSGANCTSNATQVGYITVVANPVANFYASPTTLCANNPVTTFNNSSTGSGLSYTWDFGDGSPTSTQTSPQHTYPSNTGSYNIKLYVTSSAGCTDTFIRTNYINVVPAATASFTGPAGVCVGAPATFNNTSSPTTGSSWAFGGTTTGSGSPATHIYTSPGTYTVTLTNSYNSCTANATQAIVIYPAPSVFFTSNPLHPCPAPATIQFSTSPGAVSYAWSFGDGGTASQQSPLHTYNSNGSYTVKLISTSTNGCVDSNTVTNYEQIYPLNLSITPNVTGGCVPFPVHFVSNIYYPDPTSGSAVTYPYAAASYAWSFGDGSTANTANPTHIYNTLGTYTVTLTVTTANGCSVTQTTIIKAGTPIPPSFTASPINACVKVPILFNNTTPQNATTTFTWNFGDGGASTAYSTSHLYGTPFIYDVILVSNNNGCTDTLKKQAYVTINAPNAKFGLQYSCNARNVSFINNSIGATSFLWSFGDGITDAVNINPVHLYAANGSYTVMLTTHNSTSGCSDSTVKVIVISSPQAVISIADTAFCRNDTVTLTGSIVNGPAGAAQTYSWYTTNTLYSDTSSNFRYEYATIGQKPITLIIHDYRNCDDSVTRTLLVAHPTVQFTGVPLPVCSPFPVTFTNQATDAPATYFTSQVWNYGDGNTGTGNFTIINHNYAAAGTFTVKLYVTDNVGCTDSLVKAAYVIVHKPHADFSVPGNTAICRNRAVPFSNASTASNPTYQWSFGDGGSSTAQTPVHFYLQTGIYTVKLVVTDDLGCKDSITKVNYITVVDNPVSAFISTDTISICSPLIDTFTNLSTGGVSYAWSFGDGNTSAFFNTTNVYTTPGIYNVRLVVTNIRGCTDTAIVPVKLLGYSGTLTYSPIKGCVPLTVHFTSSVTNVPTFTYDFSDGNTLTTNSTTATHTYTTVGPHVPRLILSNNRCQAYSTGIDTIKVDGIVPGFKTAPNPICGADSVKFSDTSKGYYTPISSEIWFLAKNTISTLPHPVQYYTIGNYIVTMIATSAGGCVDTSIQAIHVHPIPIISAGPDTTVCVGDSALLQPSGGVSYRWAPAALLSCTLCTAPYTSPATPSTYYVVGTDGNGCTNTDSTHVHLKTKATGTVDMGGDLCLTGSFQLNAHDSFINAQYTWLPPTYLNNSTISDPRASPKASTRYMVIIKEGKCIPDTGYVDLSVHPIPKISTGPGQTVLAGNSVTLETTETDVTRYVWIPPDYLDCDSCASPVSTPKKSTNYEVYGYTDFGCVDSAKIKIDVICDHSQVFLPNTFTPNNDGANDRFYARGKGLQIIKTFRIYDRWGELIFERTNLNLNDFSNGWDGTFKGSKLTPDVYVYVINAICDTGEPISWTGDIALLR